MKIDSKSIVIAAITLALTVAIAPIPFVFMLPLLFICTTRGMKMSLFMGLAFGVTSVFYAYATGAGLFVGEAFRRAPWIAIVPRIAVAFFAHGAFVLARRIIKPTSKSKYTAPYIIAGLVGSISNTILVVGSFLLFLPNFYVGDVTTMLAVPQMLTFGIIEAVVYAVLVPAVSIATEKAMNRYGMKRVSPTKPQSEAEQQIETVKRTEQKFEAEQKTEQQSE